MENDVSSGHGRSRRLGSSGARDLAVDALATASAREGFVRDELAGLIERSKPTPPDIDLATELTQGVMRHRITLDRVLARFFRGEFKRIDRALLPILRVGAYQILWLERIPPYAAVDSAVDQAKRLRGRKPSGLVNALLRQILRHGEGAAITGPPAEPTRCIRVDRERWRCLDVELFESPEADLEGHLVGATSHPRGLVRRWLYHFGPDQTRELCLAGGLRPPLVLRPNGLRIEAPDLIARLRGDGMDCERHDDGEAIVITGGASAKDIAAIREGLCQPQDATSQWVLRAHPPQPGRRVLDLCAGLGTKTTQLAAAMGNDGIVLACDRSPEKLGMLAENAERMGVTCVRTVVEDELEPIASEVGPFDLALVDAPCSNSGVLARRPDARYRITRRQLDSLARVQGGLLERAGGHVRPGGSVVYSVCSIEPEETAQVLSDFLVRESGWRMKGSDLTLPTAGERITGWRDGGFHALLRRAE